MSIWPIRLAAPSGLTDRQNGLVWNGQNWAIIS